MSPPRENLLVAKLAQVDGSHLLAGAAGLEARRKRVGEARRFFIMLAVAGAVMPLVAVGGRSAVAARLEIILAAEVVLALLFLFHFGFGFRATPFLAEDTFYGDRIPTRALWDASELGQFKASEVEQVVVRSSSVSEMAWLDVRVHARSGRQARFSGFTHAAMETAIGARGIDLNPQARAQLLAMGGGAEEIVDWARFNKVPLTVETDPTHRPPPAN